MSTNRKLLSGAFGGLLFTGVSMGISFLQLRVLLRHMSMEMAGIWLIFFNLGNYAMFLDLGLTPTLGREISFTAGNLSFSDAERSRRIGTLVRSGTVIVAALSSLVLIVGGPAGWFYLHKITLPSLWPGAQTAWFIYIFATALNLMGQSWFAGIYGLGQVFSEKIIRSASAIFGFILFLAAIWTDRGLPGLAVAYLVQSLFCILLARIALSRLTARASDQGNFDIQVVRGMVVPALKYAATLLGGILVLQTDNIVIASQLGTYLIPNYQAVAKLVTALMTLSMMLVLTSMPLISQAHARNDKPAIVALLNRNLRFTLATMVILGSFLACFTDRVIAVWLGPGHFVGFPILWILLAVMLLEAHYQSMAAATMSTGRLVFVTPALIAGVVNIVLSLVLAKYFGLVGVVSGTMITQILTNDWYVPWYTMRQFDLSLKQHFRSVIAPMLCLVTIMLCLEAGIRMITSHLSNLLSVEIGAVSTLLFGGLGFSLIILSPFERGSIISKLRHYRFRLNGS